MKHLKTFLENANITSHYLKEFLKGSKVTNILFRGERESFSKKAGEIFFTDNIDVTKQFSYNSDSGNFGKLIEAYVSIKNPKVVTFSDKKEVENLLGHEINEDYMSDFYGMEIKDEIIKQSLKSHDGVILKDAPEPLIDGDVLFSTVVVVKSSNQVFYL